MGLLDPEIRFGTADEFVGGYLVHQHVASSGEKAHAMLPPSYMQGAKCPWPSPMYTYRPGGTGTPGQHPPIHVIFMAATGKVLPSPSRFCLVEAPAKEWSFNNVPVPWILPAGYRNPNETVPDFLDDDNEAGSLGKESRPMPLTGAGAEVTAVDGAEEEEDGFEMVDDGDEEPGDKVVITISAKEVTKPEGSSLGGKTPMFESEEDDPEIKKRIEAALGETILLGDLMLSEYEDESDSESSDDDNDDDLDETKRYYEDQEEGTEGPGLKPSGPKAVNTSPAAVPESAGNPTGPRPDVPSGNTQPIKPGATKGKGPSDESSSKAPASKSQFSAVALGVQERRSPLSLVQPPWHRLQVWKRILSAAWKIIPVYSPDCKNWWSPWQVAMKRLQKTSDPWWPPPWMWQHSGTVPLLRGLPKPLPIGQQNTSMP